MSIEYKIGDLLEAPEIALAHGCNTQGLMGAGVARLVRDAHPSVYDAYRAACNEGTFRVGSALGVWADPATDGVDRFVYNLGTQQNPGADATVWGIFLSFANMAEDAKARHISAVAIPRIGAGIGGLAWLEVEPAIEQAITYSTHPNLAIVVYDLPGAV